MKTSKHADGVRVSASITLPVSLYASLHQRAIGAGRSLSHLVREAVEEYLATCQNDENKKGTENEDHKRMDETRRSH